MSTLQKAFELLLLFTTNILLCQTQYNYICDFDTLFAENSVGSWSHNNCQVQQTYQYANGAVAWLGSNTSTLLWTDYTIESTLRITDVSNYPWAGIIFRAQSISNDVNDGQYYYVALVEAQNRIYNAEFNNGFHTGVYEDITVNTDIDYVLRVEVSGNSWQIYLDGTLSHNSTDNSFSHGSIGFRTYDCAVTFETLYITLPTTSPTIVPTNIPTSSPTHMPSIHPSIPPSNTPSKSPSNFPSISPTTIPSNSPSKTPSNNPTNIPSISPSNNPSYIPTIGPTTSPSSGTAQEAKQSDKIVTTHVISPTPISKSKSKHSNEHNILIGILAVMLVLCFCINIWFFHRRYSNIKRGKRLFGNDNNYYIQLLDMKDTKKHQRDDSVDENNDKNNNNNNDNNDKNESNEQNIDDINQQIEGINIYQNNQNVIFGANIQDTQK